MSERVTLDTTSDGRLIAVKRSRGPDDAERLRREAEVLGLARHPGVVELLQLDEVDATTVQLTTIAVGSGPVGLLPQPEVPRVAALATAVATTLADLHLHGIVHGRIDGSHVLVDGDGRPVLCGFAEARTSRGGDGPVPADDVAGLGRLMLTLLGQSLDAEPIPELRPRVLRRRRNGWTGYQQRALLTLADQASADEPGHRPSARALAAALSAAFPDARLGPAPPSEADAPVEAPAGHDPTPPPPPTGGAAPPPDAEAHDHAEEPHADRSGRPKDVRRVLVAAAAVVVGVLGLTSLAAGTSTVRGGPRPEVVATAEGQPSPSTTAATSPSSTSSTTTPPVRCEATEGPAADLDGDGCPAPLSVEGTVVTGDGGRFQVGEEGDEVVLGDWDCDGSSTPALLRPDGGEVFVFERWARDEAEVTVHAVDAVEGATAIEVRRDEACDRLVVEGPEGEHEVDLERTPPEEAP